MISRADKMLRLIKSKMHVRPHVNFFKNKNNDKQSHHKNKKSFLYKAVPIGIFALTFYHYNKYKKYENDKKAWLNREDKINQRKSTFVLQKEQLQFAAIWWAQYLPTVKDIMSSKMPYDLYSLSPEKKIKNKITTEQYDQFIKLLADKFSSEKTSHDIFSDKLYIKIGSRALYGPPDIITEAMKEANIDPSLGFILFPYKTEMAIYEDGQIYINDSLIYKGNPVVEDDKVAICHEHLKKLRR